MLCLDDVLYIIQNTKTNIQSPMPNKSKLLANYFIFLAAFINFGVSLNIHPQERRFHQNHLPRGEHKDIPRFNHKNHRYYNVEQTNRVSQSRSIKTLNQCKNICLEMHQLFPFQFKYHRLIYRQQAGNMKYITGRCLYAFKTESNQRDLRKQKSLPGQQNFPSQENSAFQTDSQNSQIQEPSYFTNENSLEKQRKWYKWTQLKQFLDMSIIHDQTYEQQKKAYHSYYTDCQEQSLKLTQMSLAQLRFTIVHSDFQYYENQGFVNKQPFDDLGQLIANLSPPK